MKVFMQAVAYNLGVKARALHIAPSEEMMLVLSYPSDLERLGTTVEY